VTLEDLHNIFLREQEVFAEWNRRDHIRALCALPNQKMSMSDIEHRARTTKEFALACDADFHASMPDIRPQRRQVWRAAKVYTIARDERIDAAMLWKLANDD